VIDYAIDREHRLVKARMHDSTSFVDLVAHISSLAQNPGFNPAFDLIFEISPAATFAILPVEVEFVKLVKQWMEQRRGTKWAFVVPFGTAHAHMEYVLGRLVQTHVRLRLFETEKEALEWLAADTPDDTRAVG
jgi:hypothetical protein